MCVCQRKEVQEVLRPFCLTRRGRRDRNIVSRDPRGDSGLLAAYPRISWVAPVAKTLGHSGLSEPG